MPSYIVLTMACVNTYNDPTTVKKLLILRSSVFTQINFNLHPDLFYLITSRGVIYMFPFHVLRLYSYHLTCCLYKSTIHLLNSIFYLTLTKVTDRNILRRYSFCNLDSTCRCLILNLVLPLLPLIVSYLQPIVYFSI